MWEGASAQRTGSGNLKFCSPELQPTLLTPLIYIYITNHGSWTTGQEGHTPETPKSLASTTPLGIQRMRPYSCFHRANAPPLAVQHMCLAGVRNKEGQESSSPSTAWRSTNSARTWVPKSLCSSRLYHLDAYIKREQELSSLPSSSKRGLQLMGVPYNEWQGCCGALSS